MNERQKKIWAELLPLPFGKVFSKGISIKFSCECGKHFKAPANLRHALGICPKCGREIPRPESKPKYILDIICNCGKNIAPEMEICNSCGKEIISNISDGKDSTEVVESNIYQAAIDDDSNRKRDKIAPERKSDPLSQLETELKPQSAPAESESPKYSPKSSPKKAPQHAAACKASNDESEQDKNSGNRIARERMVYIITSLIYLAYIVGNEYFWKPKMRDQIQAGHDTLRQFQFFEERISVRDSRNRENILKFDIQPKEEVRFTDIRYSTDVFFYTPPTGLEIKDLRDGVSRIRWTSTTPWKFLIFAAGYEPQIVMLDGHNDNVRTILLDAKQQ